MNEVADMDHKALLIPFKKTYSSRFLLLNLEQEMQVIQFICAQNETGSN